MRMDPVLGKARKFYASRFYQLKVGHGAIGTFLHRIGATGSVITERLYIDIKQDLKIKKKKIISKN